MQTAAGAQLAHQQLGKARLDQATLVVALLVPRVGEIDAHFVQCAIGDFLFQHFHRVVVVQAHVVGVIVGQRVQQAADAGRVHFQADVIAAGVVLCGKA
ncbi:hypothetical protein D3C73_1520910 [compost metagenome]